jgi:hypothetical protein
MRLAALRKDRSSHGRLHARGPVEPAHVVRLHEPEVDSEQVTFRWSVTPETELYRRTEFTLSFPASVDVQAVPRSLWWRVLLICLHMHWALLRPCRVEFPIALGAAEREFWARLVANATAQIEVYGGAARPGPAVELIDDGPLLEPDPVRTDRGRACVAFSGGKDSLVLTALLAELTERPLAVTITSPVAWARDHVGAARYRAREQIAARLGIEMIEVRSDFRTSWDMAFSARDGCKLGVHELTDLPLYHGVMAVVAAARGVGRLSLASEADIQYNAEGGDGVILHPEFPSCAVTQSALDALWRRFGLRQGSLIYPLHMPQVQGLLLRRYRALADLQFSCWRAPPGERACSECMKCFQVALVTLAEGVSPTLVGIDPVAALCAHRDWRLDAPGAYPRPALHETRTARHHLIGCLQALPTERLAATIAADPLARDNRRAGEAVAVYARMRAEALSLKLPPSPGYIAGLLEFVAPDLRGRLGAIFDQYYEPGDAHEFAPMIARARGLAAWIAEPLRSETR